jgi:hypothetical protein
MLSKEGLDLILEFEVGGSDGSYYNKFLKKPTVPAWQTTKSGVTIGVGTDMGYQSQSNVDEEWSEYLKPAEIKKLYSVLGLKGADAYHNLDKVKGIEVPWETAKSQFNKFTIPRYTRMAQSTFPNFDAAPISVQEGLISLVFNRGNSTKGASRREMRQIVTLMSKKQWDGIPEQIRSMKRLWPNVKGLLKRRDAEAKFIEDGLK